MKLSGLLFRLGTMILVSPTIAIQVDCSMSDTTRCDCIYSNSPSGTLAGTDCRVCRVEGQLMCVLWGSSGTRYGPLCEEQKCPTGATWKDGKQGPEQCYCDWGVKVHDRMPCPTPAGDCKCSFVDYTPSGTVTSVLPGQTCTVCPSAPDDGFPWLCTETGNKKNAYGPLCMGAELGPQCRGKNCVCNWMVTMDGVGWRNETS